ncbi:MAG TPA: hypothetical protein DDY38_01675, partial [Firmicutes bacterium]|nr:hypothetical protein [Bacillota bacterium]
KIELSTMKWWKKWWNKLLPERHFCHTWTFVFNIRRIFHSMPFTTREEYEVFCKHWGQSG